MLIFPAIDLYDGKAVRLYKGDYAQMTVYSENPPEIAETFCQQGADCLHLVDLEGAKTGETPNLDTIKRIRAAAPLFIEVGGGVRSMAVVERYLEAGIDRVILGTAAVTDPVFLREAVETYREKIAVGVDIRDGKVAIRGWLEKSERDAFDFGREQAEYLSLTYPLLGLALTELDEDAPFGTAAIEFQTTLLNPDGSLRYPADEFLQKAPEAYQGVQTVYQREGRVRS